MSIRSCGSAVLGAALLQILLLVCAAPPVLAQRGLTPPRSVKAAVLFETVNGSPKAYVQVDWSSVAAAQSYRVFRNGGLLAGGITALRYADKAVTPGQTYSYTVASVNGTTQSGQSRPASVTIPAANPTAWPAAPTGLRVKGVWINGATDLLAWYPSPGAAKYRIYQYNRVLAETTATNFTVPTAQFISEVNYSVTAVRADGEESIPSNIVQSIGAPDPAHQPSWMPDVPPAPTDLSVTPEWNNGIPRNRLAWNGHPYSWTYNIYRDGNLIATGIWQLTYIDSGVTPNQACSYRVTGSNIRWTTVTESAPSAAVGVTALSGPPTLSNTQIGGISVVSNDDSAVISFPPVAGAADYRIANPSAPGVYKYSGGSLSIEVNGLTPGVAQAFVLEAVDKLGPLQKMDGSLGPGGTHAGGYITQNDNGQGDPSNLPNVLARSASFNVTAQARALTGGQAFFENFRSFASLVQTAVDPVIAAAQGWDAGNDPNNRYVREWQNNRWVVRNYGGDMNLCRFVVRNNHLVETFLDGGTLGSSTPLHGRNSALVLFPKATADITGGRVLHVTFEVDAHFSSRRWCGVVIGDAGDLLTKPNDFYLGRAASVSGKLLRWEVNQDKHVVLVSQGVQSNGNATGATLVADGGGGTLRRIGWDGTPFLNGTTQDLDKRHRFDLYLSASRVRVVENGTVVMDKALPASLNFPLNRLNVYFEHQVYHTGVERPDFVQWKHREPYWINHRPYDDQRHWDNLGFEVLGSFPG